jgi:FAD synthase
VKTFKLNTNSTFKYSNINLAIGNFDGIHLGHQTIIKKLISDSKKMKIKSAILSFEPHPRQYFEKNLNNHLIINHVTKETLFRDLGIDYNIIFSFDSSIASLGASSFVEKILVKMLKIKNITVGYDFKFGKNRKGNVDLLKRLSKKYDYKISFIDPVINPVTSESVSFIT